MKQYMTTRMQEPGDDNDGNKQSWDAPQPHPKEDNWKLVSTDIGPPLPYSDLCYIYYHWCREVANI